MKLTDLLNEAGDQWQVKDIIEMQKAHERILRATSALQKAGTNLEKISKKNRSKPKNLILIYSNKYIDRLDIELPKHFDKVFNNVSKHTSSVNCKGKCLECMMCYTLGNQTTQIIEVKK